MFKALLIAALVGVAMARSYAPPPPVHHPAPKAVAHVAHVSHGDDVHAEVLKQAADVRADGFESQLDVSNSISQQSSGDVHGNIHGGFSWVSPEGEHIQIKYVADEHGYQPVGEVLPTPPPVPVEIQRALEWIAAHPSKEVVHHH